MTTRADIAEGFGLKKAQIKAVAAPQRVTAPQRVSDLIMSACILFAFIIGALGLGFGAAAFARDARDVPSSRLPNLAGVWNVYENNKVYVARENRTTIINTYKDSFQVTLVALGSSSYTFKYERVRSGEPETLYCALAYTLLTCISDDEFHEVTTCEYDGTNLSCHYVSHDSEIALRSWKMTKLI